MRRSMPAGGEAGFVGGAEGLAFGVLVFVAGTLVVAGAWGAIDAKMATATAAREAARAFVEAPDAATAARRAREAAAGAMAQDGRSLDRVRVRVDGTFERCARVTAEVAYRAPFIRVPGISGTGHGLTVTARHSEIVDPYRSGVSGEVSGCAEVTR